MFNNYDFCRLQTILILTESDCWCSNIGQIIITFSCQQQLTLCDSAIYCQNTIISYKYKCNILRKVSSMLYFLILELISNKQHNMHILIVIAVIFVQCGMSTIQYYFCYIIITFSISDWQRSRSNLQYSAMSQILCNLEYSSDQHRHN